MRFRPLFKLATLLVAGLFAVQVMAQTIVTGDVTGTVTDPSNAVVSGATVTLSSVDTGTNVSTKTTATGLYRFPLLKPGNYKVTVTQAGFRTSAESVVVAIGAVTTANIQLQIGQGSETVEVTGAAPLIQTENANLQTTVSEKEVLELPNSGNDLTAIAQTAPGVTMNSSSGGGYGNFTAFGLPATANLFTVNGNDEMDPYLNLNNSGATNLLLGKNEVQEAAVVSNGYTGQYGRQAGAQVDYATVSGTNQYHGNAMYWWNGRTMNANDWFNNETVPVTNRGFVNNNQFAARFGGPIKKDKAFFFVDYEGLRLITASSTQVFLPTPQYFGAILNNLATVDPAAVPFYQTMGNLFAGAKGSSAATPVGGAIANYGCSDLVSAGVFAPFGDPAFGGGGGSCTESYRSTVGSPSHEWILAGRGDINLTNNDKLYLRYRMDRGLQPTSSDPVSPLFSAVSNQPQYEGQINYTRTINPTTINSFIASGSWYSAIFDVANRPAALAAFPYFLIDESGASWLANSGGLGASSAFPQGRKVTQYQITDDLSMTRGNHEFKTGINFRRNDITDGLFGRRTIPQILEGSQELFANGLTNEIRQYFPEQLEQPMAIYSLGAYFQDIIRVKSNLKLTLTLRADRNSNLVCQTDCIARFTGPFTQLSHDPNIPFNQMFGENNSLFPQIEKVAFQPRFGFAWNPWGKSDTVLRGGIGLFTDLYPGTLADSFALNSPTSNRFTFSPPNPAPISPADTSNPAGPPAEVQIQACNTAFKSAFSGGLTVGQYQSLAPGCAVPQYNSILPQTVQNPKYTEWNLELQHSFGQKTSVSINYVGNRGTDIYIFNPWVNAGSGLYGALGITFPGLPATPPDSRVSLVEEMTNGGNSYYNGLTMSATRRFTHGFTGSINYTWSHATDDVSNGGISPYSLNDSLLYQLNPQGLNINDYSNADYDVRHNLTASYIWDLPFKSSSSILNEVVGGWSISGTFFARSGYPFTASDGLQTFLFSNTYANVTLIPAQWNGTGPTSCGHPTQSGPGVLAPCMDAGSQFPLDNNLNYLFDITGACPNGDPNPADCPFNTSFSTTRRNQFRGPGYFNSDLDLLKKFKVTERVNFAVGANFYNIFNHPNFSNPNTDVGNIFNAPFGTVTSTVVPPTSIYGAFVGSAVSGRLVQLHARIEF